MEIYNAMATYKNDEVGGLERYAGRGGWEGGGRREERGNGMGGEEERDGRRGRWGKGGERDGGRDGRLGCGWGEGGEGRWGKGLEERKEMGVGKGGYGGQGDK